MIGRLGQLVPSAVCCALIAGGCADEAPAAHDAGTDAGVSDAGGAGAAPVDAAPPDSGIGGERWFEDMTPTSGVSLDRTPVDGWTSIPDRMSGGVCVIDVDGRSPLDLFFAVRPGSAGGSRLYVARAPFDYGDETVARGLSDVGDAVGCLAVDLDGDADDDLLVTGLGSLRLFRNDGGTFVDESARLGVTLDAGAMLTSAAAGDIDGDGDLDLVVGGFVAWNESRYGPEEICGVIPCRVDLPSWDWVAGLLLEQDAAGRFVDRTATLAPDLVLEEPTLVVALADFDGDGGPDVYVGNDLGFAFRDRVLVRDAATGAFGDRGEALGLAYNRRGYGIDTMGWSTADVDGDGALDHAVTSFEGDATALFICAPGSFCEDRAATLGTTFHEESFRWGVALVDLDLDGAPELVEATGHYYPDDEGAAIGLVRGRDQPQNILANVGDGRFRFVPLAADDGLSRPGSMRGLAVADLDDDGRPDVVLAPAVGRARVLRNVREPVGRHLHVRLRGRSPNTAGVGARVTVRGVDRSVVRERVAGEGYLGNFDPRVLVGLDEPGPVEVEVRWRSGERTVVTGVALGGEVTVTQ